MVTSKDHQSKEPSGFEEAPKKVSNASQKLIKILNWCQADDVSTNNAIKELRKVFEPIKENVEERRNFFQNLVFMLQIPLTNGSCKERPNKFDEKLFEIVCRFAATYLEDQKNDESEELDLPWLIIKLFVWLLNHHGVSSSSARLRICMLINWLLKNFGDFDLDDDLYEKIFSSMLDRLGDKVAEIRAQAVTALCRLQNPQDPDCQVIKAFLFHLGCDPSPLVRLTVIKTIGASKHTLMFVVKRTMDVDEKVRLAAYKFLNDKVHIKSLTISCREELLNRGLNDKSKIISNFVSKHLVQTWLNQYQGSIVNFLHALDIGNSDGKTAERVLNEIFTGSSYDQLTEAFNLADAQTKLIPLSGLTIEAVFYWKSLVKYFHEETEKSELCNAGTFLEQILPELTPFCRYVRAHFAEMMEAAEHKDSEEETDESLAEEQRMIFVGKTLIEMTSYFDLSDEVGRQHLLKLCRALLSSAEVKTDFVASVMSVYNVVQTKADRRIGEVAEIISDLRLPLNTQKSALLPTQQVDHDVDQREKTLLKKQEEELHHKQFELAQLKLKLLTAKEAMEKAIAEQNFILAQEFKQEVDFVISQQKQVHEDIQKIKSLHTEEKNEQEGLAMAADPVQTQTVYRNDPHIIYKCLTIISELLKPKDILTMTPTLQTLLDEFVVGAASNTNSFIRKAAIKAIGCLSLRDLQAAKRYSLLVVEVCRLDCPEVVTTAIHTLVDLLMLHGPDIFEEKEVDPEEDLFVEDDPEINQNPIANGVEAVVALFCQLLDDSTNDDFQATVVEGLCKLVLSGLIVTPKLLSKFIITWFHPEAERKSRLSHILGAFLQLYPSLSTANQESLVDSLLLTVKTINEAPIQSPVSEISLDKVIAFYADLTRPSYLQTKSEQNTHDDLALLLANQVLQSPDSCMTKHYVKVLLQLQISIDNFPVLRDLQELTKQMLEVVAEKLLVKTLEKFAARLSGFLAKDLTTSSQQQPSEEDKAEVEAADDPAFLSPPNSEEFLPPAVSTQRYDEDDDDYDIETTTTTTASTASSMSTHKSAHQVKKQMNHLNEEVEIAVPTKKANETSQQRQQRGTQKRKLILPSSSTSSSSTASSLPKLPRRGSRTSSSASSGIVLPTQQVEGCGSKRNKPSSSPAMRTSARLKVSQSSSVTASQKSSAQGSSNLISSQELLTEGSILSRSSRGKSRASSTSSARRTSSSSSGTVLTSQSPNPSSVKRLRKN